jgi:hypothetical protein
MRVSQFGTSRYLIDETPNLSKSIQDSLHFNLIEDSRALVYTEDEDIKATRDPENGDIPEALRLNYLLPTDIALTEGSRYGTSLILDTQASWCSLSISFSGNSSRRVCVGVAG